MQRKAGHHRPTSQTAFKWRDDDGSTLNASLVALWFSMESGRKHIFVVIFSGEGVLTPCPLSGSAHVSIGAKRVSFCLDPFI